MSGTTTATDTRPAVLVIGGLHQKARHLVALLHYGAHCRRLRVVDRTLPQLAFLRPEHVEVYKEVDVIQNALRGPESCQAAFAVKEDPTLRWDIVFKFPLEQKLGQPAQAYELGMYIPGLECAKLALAHQALFVHLSNAFCYRVSSSNEGFATEDTPVMLDNKCDPYLRSQIKLCQALAAMPGLDHIILRHAVPYGPDNYHGVGAVLAISRIYRELEHEQPDAVVYTDPYPETWRMSTVHVADVARACWHTTQWYRRTEQHGRVLFNLADPANTTHGMLTRSLSQLWGIRTKHLGALQAKLLTTVGLNNFHDELNEDMLTVWLRLLERDGIRNTPISPYLDLELLVKRECAVDGSRICRDTGFVYEHPHGLTADALREMVTLFQQQGLFPKD